MSLSFEPVAAVAAFSFCAASHVTSTMASSTCTLLTTAATASRVLKPLTKARAASEV